VAGTNGNSVIEGTYAVTGIPTTTTFTYTTTTSGTITSAADTGSVLVKNNDYVAVTDFENQGSTSLYNVPGNVDYNADASIDRIIASNEDPSA
jgi:hypothetical protein